MLFAHLMEMYSAADTEAKSLVAKQLTAPEADRPALEQRVTEIFMSLFQLEHDIATSRATSLPDILDKLAIALRYAREDDAELDKNWLMVESAFSDLQALVQPASVRVA